MSRESWERLISLETVCGVYVDKASPGLLCDRIGTMLYVATQWDWLDILDSPLMGAVTRSRFIGEVLEAGFTPTQFRQNMLLIKVRDLLYAALVSLEQPVVIVSSASGDSGSESDDDD